VNSCYIHGFLQRPYSLALPFILTISHADLSFDNRISLNWHKMYHVSNWKTLSRSNRNTFVLEIVFILVRPDANHFFKLNQCYVVYNDYGVKVYFKWNIRVTTGQILNNVAGVKLTRMGSTIKLSIINRLLNFQFNEFFL